MSVNIIVKIHIILVSEMVEREREREFFDWVIAVMYSVLSCSTQPLAHMFVLAVF